MIRHRYEETLSLCLRKNYDIEATRSLSSVVWYVFAAHEFKVQNDGDCMRGRKNNERAVGGRERKRERECLLFASPHSCLLNLKLQSFRALGGRLPQLQYKINITLFSFRKECTVTSLLLNSFSESPDSICAVRLIGGKKSLIKWIHTVQWLITILLTTCLISLKNTKGLVTYIQYNKPSLCHDEHSSRQKIKKKNSPPQKVLE